MGEDNDFNLWVMVTWLIWITWTSISAVGERPINLITHSPTYCWLYALYSFKFFSWNEIVRVCSKQMKEHVIINALSLRPILCSCDRKYIQHSGNANFHMPLLPSLSPTGAQVKHESTPIAWFMGPTWGPSGADRTQVGLMLPPWTLLSG